MTEAQIKALILANIATQISQETDIYNAVNAGTATQVNAARAALAKTQTLETVLWEGLAMIQKQIALQLQFGAP